MLQRRTRINRGKPMARGHQPMKRSRMKKGYTPDPQHDEWRRQVLERDGYQCRWIDAETEKRCQVRGTPASASHLDAHHVNEKSQRPDLRYEPSNGATLCGGPGRHHDKLHHTVAGRKRGRGLGLLGGTTYEKAMKGGK